MGIEQNTHRIRDDFRRFHRAPKLSVFSWQMAAFCRLNNPVSTIPTMKCVGWDVG
jgi:hypothetical protein